MTDSMRDAIEKGLAAGRVEKPGRKAVKAEAKQRERLTQAFNIASGVTAGLDILKALPGSTFDYSVASDGTDVKITTNVPTEGYEWETPQPLSVTVRDNGRMTAYGDRHPDLLSGRYEENARGGYYGSAEKIVKFVAQYAAKRGLVP